MPRTKQPRPAGTADASSAVPPARPDRVFAARKAKTPPALTHERIADDMAAFRKAGGRIEVLGTTRILTRIDAGDGTPPPRPAHATQRKPGR